MADKNEKLGALWAKASSRGQYFTGQLEIDGVKTRIVVFENKFKDDEKKPDFIIYKAIPRESQEQP
jgi:uncharacterized protein (DUF736 family)